MSRLMGSRWRAHTIYCRYKNFRRQISAHACFTRFLFARQCRTKSHYESLQSVCNCRPIAVNPFEDMSRKLRIKHLLWLFAFALQRTCSFTGKFDDTHVTWSRGDAQKKKHRTSRVTWNLVSRTRCPGAADIRMCVCFKQRPLSVKTCGNTDVVKKRVQHITTSVAKNSLYTSNEWL